MSTPLGGTTESSTAADQPIVIADHPVKLHDGSFISRLTTGTGAFDVLGKRRFTYWFSTALVVLSILFILLNGFKLGIDFKGGTRLTFVPENGTDPAISQVVQVVSDAGVKYPTVVNVGSGAARSVQISAESLPADTVTGVKAALTKAFGLTHPVSDSAVSETWGSEISSRALLGVIIFLVLVALFIWIRYERRSAVGAVVSTLQVILVTAGLYAAVGFEVTPSTVIGLLTILGFSLYDTVVVYDKVQENTRGLLSMTRRTYPEAANLAVNQTLMRSINTSLIALLPVAGLLVAGVVILGSGTLKDLSLVMLVGLLVGAYSSLFIAVPIAVDLKRRDPDIRSHTAKVFAKRRHDGLLVDADGDPVSRKGVAAAAPRPSAATGVLMTKPVAPRPGARPQRPQRPRPAANDPATGTPLVAPAAVGGATPAAARTAKGRTGARPTGKRSR